MSVLPRHLLPDSAEESPEGHLIVGGVDTLDLASEFGTPLFVYDEEHLRARCREAVGEFGEGAVYATKAFLCRSMARIAHEEGMRLDVASGGEMSVALAAGVPADRLVFHGNNKSEEELQTALDVGVGRIVVDNFDELDRLERLTSGRSEKAPVLLRITPGVSAHTHEYISTGEDDSKFGFTLSTELAVAGVERASSIPGIDLLGVHAHIGSQVYRVDAFARAFEVLAEFSRPYDFGEICIGGGLGVAYVEDERAPTISEWAKTLKDAASSAGLNALISVEPGRSVVATAAVTLYTVGTIKRLPGIRTYVAVDGGMSDNPRPVLYGSGYETFLPRAVFGDRGFEVRLVGKHCESGDILVREGLVPSDIRVGDIISTPVTGAYGQSMGSNYNKVLKPAVVFVRKGEARLVVRRETYEDLLATDVG